MNRAQALGVSAKLADWKVNHSVTARFLPEMMPPESYVVVIDTFGGVLPEEFRAFVRLAREHDADVHLDSVTGGSLRIDDKSYSRYVVEGRRNAIPEEYML